MAEERVMTQEEEGNDHVYETRYGKMTAEEAAPYILHRTWYKLTFLEQVLDGYNEGDGLNLKGYAPNGLAEILNDISTDVFDVWTYYAGHEETPGKIR